MIRPAKKAFNYYLNKHKSNALNMCLKSVDQLNLSNLSELNIPFTVKYKHADNFDTSNNFAQSFTNEVLACVVDENLILENNQISKEAKHLAKYYTKDFKLGAYSESNGIAKIRENFRLKLEKQGIKGISIKDMLFTNGSVNAFEHVLSTLCEKNDQIMLPNPFYPLVRNLVTSRGIVNLEYNLNEENWGLNMNSIKNLYESNKRLYPIKAILLSNPNEPTGKIHSKKDIKELIMFCYQNKISLISWEVGSSSILEELPGEEYTQVLSILEEMPDAIKNNTTIFSIYGLTRGSPNMSPLRSGLVVIKNLDPFVHSQITKYKSIDLCSSIISQVGFDLVHSQNFTDLFGKDFEKKYTTSIQETKKNIISTKHKVISILKASSDYTINQTNSGINLFTKLNNFNATSYIKRHYQHSFNDEELITPGRFYGSNRESYVNILAKPNQDYSFLKI